MQKPEAIIFDLDGVLTNTSDYHYQAWKRLANDEGLSFTQEENDAHLRGVSRRASLLYLIRGRQYQEEHIQEMMERKNRYYNELIQQMTPDEMVAGGRELLREIRQAGIPIALASTSKNCRTVLERLDILSFFDGIADGYSVVNSKPAPDIFVYAAGLLRVPTSTCLGVEDASAGVQAIKRAGMYAVGIGPKERFECADKVFPTLAHVGLKLLVS